MYTQVFKTGDRGGNSIKFDHMLAGRLKQKDLHAYWDGQPGERRGFAAVDPKANELVAAFPKSSFNHLNATIDECATESFALARSLAYSGLVDATKQISDLPVGYPADALKTADRQVALAGSRLAEVLEDLYGN